MAPSSESQATEVQHSYIWSRLAESKIVGLLSGKLTAVYGKGLFFLTVGGVEVVPKSSSGQAWICLAVAVPHVSREEQTEFSVCVSIFPSLILEDV